MTIAIDRDRLVADLVGLVRIPSITGSEEAVAADAAQRLAEAGATVETLRPDPVAIRADPAWPGEETTRSSLPVILGRVGRPGGRRIVLS